jgi:hypothetical protein
MEQKGSKVALFLAAVLLHPMLSAEEEGKWDIYADFLYLQRESPQRPNLVFDSSHCQGRCTGDVVLNTKDLENKFGYEPAIRAAVSYVQNSRSLYEASVLYVWDWEATKTKNSDTNSLTFPIQQSYFTQNFSQISEIQAYYSSQFYTLELNYWKTFGASRTAYLAFSGVAGFRFASLQENFSITANAKSKFGSYAIKSANDLIGAQLGFLFQINPLQGLHWDLSGKSGVGLNRIEVKSFLSDQISTVQLRNFSAQTFQTNIFVEGRGAVGYRVLPSLDIHAGYEALYFCGLALAPNQINTSATRTTLKVKKNGYVVLYGFLLGMDFSF